jgi:Protein of unknown function (DUF2637)
MTGDRLIRASTALVVTAVAAFAAVVSYSHIYDLGRAHGQAGTAARLLPLSVDGLILAASLVMLHEARNRRPAPPLARFALWLGIAATLGANAAYGAPYGPLGVVVSTWPAVSFVLAVEVALGLVRRARPGAVYGSTSVQVPADSVAAAETSLRATIAAGNPLSVNQLQERFSLSRGTATKLRTAVLAESNGHPSGQAPGPGLAPPGPGLSTTRRTPACQPIRPMASPLAKPARYTLSTP